MRLAWPPPRHLIASVLIPLVALALANLSPASLQDILSPLALILVLLIPGYLATLYAFPGKNDLSAERRAFLCLAFSAIFAGSFSFILSATPRGLESASLATILSLLSIFLAAVTYGRWSNLPRNRRFLLIPRRGLAFSQPVSRSVLAILLLGACLMAGLAFTLAPHLPFQDASSNLGVTTPKEALTAPSSSPEDEKVQIKSYLPQNEEGPANDLIDLSQNNSSNSSIAGNSSLQARAATSAAANSTAIKDSKNNSPAVSNDLGDSEVFFMGGGGGGGSSSSSSSQTSTKKQAEDKATQPEKAASVTVSSSPTTSGAASGTVKSDTTAAANNLPNTSSVNNDNQTIKGNQTLEGNQTESSNSTENAILAEGGNQTASISQSTEESLSPAENLMPDQSALPETGPEEISEPLKSSPLSTEIEANESNASNEASAVALVGPAIIPTPDTNLRESPAQPEQSVVIKDSSSQAASDSASSPVSPIIDTDLSRSIRQSEIALAELNGKEADNSNQPPVLEALTADRPSPQLQGSAIFWKAEAKDEDGDKILYRFFLDGKEQRKWSKINSWSWLTPGLPAGDYQVTVLAIDGNHAGQDSFDSIMNASFTLSRPNQAPALQQLEPDRPSPQGKGSIITWTASANDPDNDPIYYRFLKNDAASTEWSQSGSWSWDTTSEKPGEYRITVQAKDGLHASKDASDSSMDDKFTLTQPNGIPEVTGLKSDRPSPQVAGSIITWTASVADPEGDGISYRFMLDDKEASQWSSSNSWSWDTSSVAPGEYHIRVLARDGSHSLEDSFDSSKDAVMTITAPDSNQPPAISSLVSDINSPDVQGVTVNWKAEAQDPDGDKVLYKFQLNGKDMGRWSESDRWRWSTSSLPPGDYRIRVLARDGKHAPENSFDSSREAVFSLISEIDQQINQLIKKRTDATQKDSYQSSDIKVTSGSGSSTSSNVVLGKSNASAGQEGAATPRKLG